MKTNQNYQNVTMIMSIEDTEITITDLPQKIEKYYNELASYGVILSNSKSNGLSKSFTIVNYTTTGDIISIGLKGTNQKGFSKEYYFNNLGVLKGNTTPITRDLFNYNLFILTNEIECSIEDFLDLHEKSISEIPENAKLIITENKKLLTIKFVWEITEENTYEKCEKYVQRTCRDFGLIPVDYFYMYKLKSNLNIPCLGKIDEFVLEDF